MPKPPEPPLSFRLAEDSGNEIAQRRQLRAHRLRATALLFVAAAVFLACSLVPEPSFWVLLVRAGAEAAMVGGLADWFAVTALFRRPLGLPIPHTAIIPENKDRIADTMAAFLQDNFLTPAVVARRMQDMNLAKAVGDYLAAPSSGETGARLRAGAGEREGEREEWGGHQKTHRPSVR